MKRFSIHLEYVTHSYIPMVYPSSVTKQLNAGPIGTS